jgi:hypothetical protein
MTAGIIRIFLTLQGRWEVPRAILAAAGDRSAEL